MEFSYRISEKQYAQALKLGLGRRVENAGLKMIVFWMFIAICLGMLWVVVSKSAKVGKDVTYSYSVLYEKVEKGGVADVTIEGNKLWGHLKASPRDEFHTTLPANHEDLLKAMAAANVDITIKPGQSFSFISLLTHVGPIVAFVAVWIFLLVRVQPGILVRGYRKNPQMQGEFTVNIVPAGISIRNTAGASSQFSWNLYEGWKEAKDLIVLKYLSGGLSILNVSALSDIQRQELRATLANALPKR